MVRRARAFYRGSRNEFRAAVTLLGARLNWTGYTRSLHGAMIGPETPLADLDLVAAARSDRSAIQPSNITPSSQPNDYEPLLRVIRNYRDTIPAGQKPLGREIEDVRAIGIAE